MLSDNDIYIYIAIIYVIFINILAFNMYGYDKVCAQRGLCRVPESKLLGIALIGGSIGAFAGMHVFHHKTHKPRFRVGIPIIIIMQALAIVMMLLILSR